MQDERKAAVVAVIGASSGIGLATARACAARGDQLVLGSRSQKSLAAAAKSCKQLGAASVRSQVVDVADGESVREFFESVSATAERLDVVVHTAATMAYGRLVELDPELFQAVTRTVIEGTFAVARHALGIFDRQRAGTLIVVNSLVGSIAAPQLGAYVTAKWGQAGLLRTLQLEVAGQPDIHVCSIAPGGVNTPIYRQAANVTGRSVKPPIPVDQPEKVAEAILRCMDRPRDRISVGLANHLIRLGFEFFPWLYDRMVGPLLYRLSLTGGPTQPSTGNVLAPKPDGEEVSGPWHRRWSS
ncbi:MAG: SDR family NAD(P)-dependent oxidoreductase [Jatrophihabitantaceae bacterium]